MKKVQNKTQLRRITTKRDILVELAVPGGVMLGETTKRFAIDGMWEMALTFEWDLMFECTNQEVFLYLRPASRK